MDQSKGAGTGEAGGASALSRFEPTGQAPPCPPPRFYDAKPPVLWAGRFFAFFIIKYWTSWPLVTSRTRIQNLHLMFELWRTVMYVHHWVHRTCPPHSQILPGPLDQRVLQLFLPSNFSGVGVWTTVRYILSYSPNFSWVFPSIRAANFHNFI